MKNKKNISIEDAFMQLDEIINKIENNNLPLDQMIDLFEEGSIISAHCKEKILDAEKRINMVIDKYKK